MGSLSLSPHGNFLLYGVTFCFLVFGTSFGFRIFLRRLPLFHFFGKDLTSTKGNEWMPKIIVEVETRITQVDE